MAINLKSLIMKTIFHLGAQKTASTHLQQNLQLNRKLLKQKGVIYIKLQKVKFYKNIYRLRDKHKKREFNIEKSLSFIRKSLNNELKGYDTAIISYEGALGNMFLYKTEDIYEEIETQLSFYNEILKGHEVIPVYATRNYDDFLRSTYKWQLEKMKRHLTLNEYLHSIKFSKNRWSFIVQLLDKTFDQSVKMFTYEDYKKDWKKIIYQLIKLAGKSIQYDELQFDSQKKNVSGKKNEVDCHYTTNLFLQKTPNFKGKRRLYKFMREHSSFFKTKLGSKFLLSHQKRDIPPLNDFDDYWEEATELKRRFGILKK